MVPIPGVKRTAFILSECLLCLLLVVGTVIPIGRMLRHEVQVMRQERTICEKIKQAYLKNEMDWYVQIQKR